MKLDLSFDGLIEKVENIKRGRDRGLANFFSAAEARMDGRSQLNTPPIMGKRGEKRPRDRKGQGGRRVHLR